ncbi:M1 family aminopeptidase [Ramlibacter sp. WS9]|uniref:M1 family metallopeptidase n=1 Tax=Ramlibacter sp. WS9 TaxID=1882741 RepID=UPI001305198F|nr:M1 family aminopeptidase [Ramlibacter sp. WS9]
MIIPLHYSLLLDADAQAHTFSGEVAITLALSEAAAEVRLDCVELEIDGATIDGSSVPWRIEPGLLVLTPQAPLRPGQAIAEIRFRGRLGRVPRGLYQGDGFVATHMQPMHARRVFPCFDDPRYRAVFDLTARVPAGKTAISNAEILHEEPGTPKHTITFAASPAIPTYLLALAIGPFERLPDATRRPPLAVHALRAPESCALALRIARQALDFYGEWLARPLPLRKLDLVVLPRSGVAGMENTGAIFLRESAVMVAEDAAPQACREAANLVAHEVAHHWFGGLVTPGSWNHLWLNEGFATWMAPKALAVIAPELTRDEEEVRAIREALHGDVGPGARALEANAESAAEVEELFDATAYRKGAALLRMLEAWLGEPALQQGLRAFLDRHANGTVTSEDLWLALEQACDEPVGAVARPFLTRIGAPHLAVRWAGTTLEVTQVGDELSTIPVRLRVALEDGSEQVVSLLLEGPPGRAVLPSPIRWAFGDAGAVGYYRCSYPGGRAPVAGLSPSEAVVLVEDAWLALWAGEADLPGYLSLAGEALTARSAIPSLRNHLEELRDLLANGARAPLFDNWVTALAAGVDEQIRASSPKADDAALFALLEDPKSDESAAMAAVEALLANPATRGACWSLLKDRWDELGSRLVGLGGRGAIAGLAAFADPAVAADIAAFFAGRDLRGAERMLRASLDRIAGRARFREGHQAAMDAFLLRQSAPAGPPPQRLRAEHALLAGMAAGFRGALLQRSLFDRFDLPAPPWMHTPENLRGALGSAERQLALLHRGAPVASRGDIDLAQRLREDLLAAARQLELLVRRLADDARRASFLTVAAGFARATAMIDRELEAALVFAALFDPESADGLRRAGAEARSALRPARGWIAEPAAGVPTREQRLALQNDAVLAPGLLRRHADRIQAQLAAMGSGKPPGPLAAWGAFGFDGSASKAWRAAGFEDPEIAAGWRLRSFDPQTARRHADQGADPAALRAL